MDLRRFKRLVILFGFVHQSGFTKVLSWVCMAWIAESQSQGKPSVVAVDALRFRPNIVVTGADAHDEDNWDSISICSQKFGVRPWQLLFCSLMFVGQLPRNKLQKLMCPLDDRLWEAATGAKWWTLIKLQDSRKLTSLWPLWRHTVAAR